MIGEYYHLLMVLLGIGLLGLSTALVGVFSFLQNKTLVSEALGHAALPGLVLGFILSAGEKNYLSLFFGVFVASFCAMGLLSILQQRTLLKTQVAIAVVLSIFYGLGVFLLSGLQAFSQFEQSGLDRYLLGRPAAISEQDVWMLLVLFLVSWSFSLWKLPVLKIVLFDAEFARNREIAVAFYRAVLTLLLVLGIAIGIQAVGALLIAAFLIIPALAARRLSYHLPHLMMLCVFFTLFSSGLGLFLSYRYEHLATGATIVFILSCVAFLVFVFAPSEGLWTQFWRNYRHRYRIIEENILKTMYELAQAQGDFSRAFSPTAICQLRFFQGAALLRAFKRMQQKGWLIINKDTVLFTEKGLLQAKKVHHLHLLWEKYLEQRMQFKSDHVHSMAELMEHVITPELEKMIHADLEKFAKSS